jgi:hypothetical protein
MQDATPGGRHTEALSWAVPSKTTRPSPPSLAASSIRGRAQRSLLSPFSNWNSGTPSSFAQRRISATYCSPIFPNAAEDGVETPRW